MPRDAVGGSQPDDAIGRIVGGGGHVVVASDSACVRRSAASYEKRRLVGLKLLQLRQLAGTVVGIGGSAGYCLEW